VKRSAERAELSLLGLAGAFLLLTCLALTIAPRVQPGGTPADTRFQHWLVVPAWLLAALLGRGALRRRLPQHAPAADRA
jgi:hypothetical protein